MLVLVNLSQNKALLRAKKLWKKRTLLTLNLSKAKSLEKSRKRIIQKILPTITWRTVGWRFGINNYTALPASTGPIRAKRF